MYPGCAAKPATWAKGWDPFGVKDTATRFAAGTFPRKLRDSTTRTRIPRSFVMAKPLNIGMIGYGFMGRAHSNGYRRVSNFFDLEYTPVLKAVAARDMEKAKAFADKWGYESIESDWRKLIERKDID